MASEEYENISPPVDSAIDWQESATSEIEAFDRIASIDYNDLLKAYDWNTKLLEICLNSSSEFQTLRILDCGVGQALFSKLLSLSHKKINFAFQLLDKSPFSLRKASMSLSALDNVKILGATESTFENYESQEPDAYDIVWSIHGLYQVDQNLIGNTILKLSAGLKSDGFFFIAHADNESHYIEYDRAFIKDFPEQVSHRKPFISAEEIAEALRLLDMPFEVVEVKGEAHLKAEDSLFLEKFLKFCTFSKNLIPLEKLMNTPNTKRYINSIRQNNGNFRLNLTSKMFVIKGQDLA